MQNTRRLFLSLHKYTRKTLCHDIQVRHRSITGHMPTDVALKTMTGGRVDRWLQAYEDFVGLTEVKQAQTNVIQVKLSMVWWRFCLLHWLKWNYDPYTEVVDIQGYSLRYPAARHLHYEVLKSPYIIWMSCFFWSFLGGWGEGGYNNNIKRCSLNRAKLAALYKHLNSYDKNHINIHFRQTEP